MHMLLRSISHERKAVKRRHTFHQHLFARQFWRHPYYIEYGIIPDPMSIKANLDQGWPTLAFKPNLQIASQSSLDCVEAAGEVTSI